VVPSPRKQPSSKEGRIKGSIPFFENGGFSRVKATTPEENAIFIQNSRALTAFVGVEIGPPPRKKLNKEELGKSNPNFTISEQGNKLKKRRHQGLF